MKIAVIGAKGLPPKQGGIEHHCAELYPRLVAQGHTVDLYARSSYTNASLWKSYNYQGVRVISLPSVNLRGIDAFVNSMLGAIAATGKKYDIVHFHALGPSLFTGLPRIHKSTKIVVTCHGLDWERAKWGNFSTRLLQMGEKAAAKLSHELIVVSEALQTYFWQNYDRQTVCIPNAPASYGESDPKFTYGSQLGLKQNKYIFFLGRLVPEKRPDLLVKAFSELKPPGWKLVLAGGVSDTHAFSAKLLDTVACNRDILFLGELNGARLWEIMRGAGLFVLPSDVEGMPLVVLEAMQEGIPVLLSNILPHQELVNHGGRGLLFEAGNIDSCISSLEWSMNHTHELAIMAKNAQRYVQQQYNWEKIATDTLRVYKNILNSSVQVNIGTQSESKLSEVSGGD